MDLNQDGTFLLTYWNLTEIPHEIGNEVCVEDGKREQTIRTDESLFPLTKTPSP